MSEKKEHEDLLHENSILKGQAGALSKMIVDHDNHFQKLKVQITDSESLIQSLKIEIENLETQKKKIKESWSDAMDDREVKVKYRESEVEQRGKDAKVEEARLEKVRENTKRLDDELSADRTRILKETSDLQNECSALDFREKGIKTKEGAQKDRQEVLEIQIKAGDRREVQLNSREISLDAREERQDDRDVKQEETANKRSAEGYKLSEDIAVLKAKQKNYEESHTKLIAGQEELEKGNEQFAGIKELHELEKLELQAKQAQVRSLIHRKNLQDTIDASPKPS